MFLLFLGRSVSFKSMCMQECVVHSFLINVLKDYMTALLENYPQWDRKVLHRLCSMDIHIVTDLRCVI
jgi:hypothetical protein